MLEPHRVLLADRVRTDAYRAALEHFVGPDSVVLDLGAGSGILSILACRAGARRVYAVEQSHAADVLAVLVRHLGLGGRLELLHERSANVELSERAGVLVTETMGSFGLEEQILSSVIDARSRLLRPGAVMIPRSIGLSLVPVELPDVFARYVGWWHAPYDGFDLSPLAVFASNAMYLAEIGESAYLAGPQEILAVDLSTIEDPAVTGRASFVAMHEGLLHGFGGWFAAELAPGVVLSNARPGVTGWPQKFLPLERPVPVERGAGIDVEVQTDDGRAWRWHGVVRNASPVRFDQTTWLANPPCHAAR